ncbi:hypothetical protein [Dinoroseobacter sp. S124A]|uniref:hypothetical protein n=1 Tax=Dinoroseobacter sp. S124A TaxID=3415128 RepID=UPI003C7AFCBB
MITDLKTPDEDGFDLIRLARKQSPEMENPVISVLGDKESVVTAISSSLLGCCPCRGRLPCCGWRSSPRVMRPIRSHCRMTGALTPTARARSGSIAFSCRAPRRGSLSVLHTGILGAFRSRAEQQLTLSGITLDWKMVEIPSMAGQIPSLALHILRVMQQAVTRAVKHFRGGSRDHPFRRRQGPVHVAEHYGRG